MSYSHGWVNLRGRSVGDVRFFEHVVEVDFAELSRSSEMSSLRENVRRYTGRHIVVMREDGVADGTNLLKQAAGLKVASLSIFPPGSKEPRNLAVQKR